MRARLAGAAAVGLALAFVVAAGAATVPPATMTPGVLTVGLAMPSEGFQVGVVEGSTVIYAQGFEIDLAKALTTRMGLRSTVFVQNRFDRLYSSGTKPFDVGMGEISITEVRKRAIDFSRPYMDVDQGVLVAQSVGTVPTTIRGLKPLKVCALAKSTGADIAQKRIAPTRPVLLIGNVPTLMLNLQTGRCDAVVYDAPALGTLKARAPLRYGPFAGVIKTGEHYGIAIPRGGTLLAPLNRALASLSADGTIERLAQKWLTFDPSKARILR